jgi:YidC/Oxa1 family membrane protein insertase
MFGWLYRLLGSMLAFFGNFGGYALALLLYALIFKVVFLPFSIKQQKNQIAMAKLAPKIELIKAKYRGRTDQRTMQKQQQEIMELQQKEGYSPLSGCLPLLIQLPLIMLLYTVINNPLSYIAKTTDDYQDADKSTVILEVYKSVTDDAEIDKLESLQKGSEIKVINAINNYVNNYDSNPFQGTDGQFATKEGRIEYIESLGLDYETIPNFYIGKTNLAETPSLKNLSILCIIPFIAAGAQWVSMWLTRKFNGNSQMQMQDAQTQASMKIMDFMFPAMTLFMAFSFSAMLGLYWIYQTSLGLLQAFILSRVMPLPKYSEEELKSMRKAQKDAEKAQREAAKSQPKYRSLHYIDDDDYDVLPDAPKSEESKSTRMDGEIPEIKD